MSGTSRFPIGEWARQRKEKRQVLVEANTCIQELEGKITELKRKARTGNYVVKMCLINLWFCHYKLIIRLFSSRRFFDVQKCKILRLQVYNSFSESTVKLLGLNM